MSEKKEPEDLTPESIVGITVKELSDLAIQMYLGGWKDCCNHMVAHTKKLNAAALSQKYCEEFLADRTKKIFIPKIAEKKIIIPPNNNTPS